MDLLDRATRDRLIARVRSGTTTAADAELLECYLPARDERAGMPPVWQSIYRTAHLAAPIIRSDPV